MASADNISNSTQPQTVITNLNSYLLQQIGYITLGSAAFLLSSIVTVSLVLKSVELRHDQRHILLTTMEIANSCVNFTFFLAGSFRLKYALTGEYKLNVTPWECMLRVYTPMFVFALEFASWILLAVACDRFAAVCFPIFYYQTVRTKHHVVASTAIMIYCISVTLAAFLYSYHLDQGAFVPYNCLTSDALGPFSTFDNTSQFTLTAFSAIVSLAVVLSVCRKSKIGHTASSNPIPVAYSRRQRKLSKALIVSTMFEIAFLCSPTVVRLMTTLKIGGSHINQVIGPFNNFLVISHSIFSDIALCVMNEQVRESLASLFRFVEAMMKKVCC